MGPWEITGLTCLVLAAIPYVLGIINVFMYRAPPVPDGKVPPVSVLIPARNEEKRIVPTIKTLLESEEVEFELIIADDHSTDGTARILDEFAKQDDRVRVVQVPDLPKGWAGKMHACHILSEQANYEIAVFVDSDVTVSPDALARLSGFLDVHKEGMVSGLPCQETGTFWEELLVPQIHVLLLGYLPFFGMRLTTWPAFGAGCGQLLGVRMSDYRKAGGHKAISHLLHDALQLSRLFRSHGIRTDMVDITGLSETRMYESFSDLWAGFSKNAHEGMATPIALPVWTVLLGGGHVLPFLLVVIGLLMGWPAGEAVFACLLIYAFRFLLAKRYRQSILGVILHPMAVVVMLALQWVALFRRLAGKPVTWRGREYVD